MSDDNRISFLSGFFISVIMENNLSQSNYPFCDSFFILCACDSDGVDCSDSMVSMSIRCSSGLRYDNSTAGVNAIFFSSTIFMSSGCSSVKRMYRLNVSPLIFDSFATLSSYLNLDATCGEVKSVRIP